MGLALSACRCYPDPFRQAWLQRNILGSCAPRVHSTHDQGPDSPSFARLVIHGRGSIVPSCPVLYVPPGIPNARRSREPQAGTEHRYFLGFWVSTLPASDLVLEPVRPSLSALPAVRAVFVEDCLVVPACASALPARDLAVLLAPGSRSTDEAVRVTLGPDCSRLDIVVFLSVGIRASRCLHGKRTWRWIVQDDRRGRIGDAMGAEACIPPFAGAGWLK